MRGSVVSSSCSAAMMTAAARVAASFGLYLLADKNVISPAPACSSEPTCRISVCASPATRPPRREAICPSVSGPGIALFRGRLAFERLDHLVGDVDARAREHGVLEDDVELLLLRDLPDDAVRLLDHLRQLLVAALVQVLAELALPALEIAVLLGEFALLAAALRLAHGHRVLLDVVLHALELLGHLGELLVALLELGLDLLLRAHRRDRVAQDALGVDEAELAGQRRRRRLVLGCKRHSDGERRSQTPSFHAYDSQFRTPCRT